MTIFSGIVLSWLLAIVTAILKKITGWKDVGIFHTFAFFVVPLLVIIAAYIAIFITAKKSLKEHRKRSLKKVILIAFEQDHLFKCLAGFCQPCCMSLTTGLVKWGGL